MKSLNYFALPVILMGLTLTGCNKATETSSTSVKSTQSTTNEATKKSEGELDGVFKLPSIAENYVSPLPDEAPTVVVAIEKDDYPPFEYKDQNGNLLGFDVDVLRAVGEEAGFKIQFYPMVFDKVLTSLDDGKSQLAAAAMSVTDERIAKYAPTSPYAKDVGSTVFVIKDDPSITEASQLLNKDTKFVVQSNTYQLEEIKAEEGMQVEEVQSSFLALQAVMMGEADAWVVGDATSKNFTSQYPEIKFKDLSWHIHEKPFVFYIAKHDTKLQKQVNEGIKKLIAKPKYQKLTEKWFGKEKADNFNITKSVKK